MTLGDVGDFLEHVAIAVAATVGAVMSVRNNRRTKRIEEQVNGKDGEDA